MVIELRRVGFPEIGVPVELPEMPVVEFEERARRLRERAGTSWVAIYGDREHAANLQFVCGYDPRFEEGMLLLGPGDRAILLVGNEGLIHAQVTRLPVEVVLYQPFSLMAQPRGDSPPLAELLVGLGLEGAGPVGVAGWKYLDTGEASDVTRPAYVPAFVVEALEAVSGAPSVDVTPVLINPVDGLRSVVSADEVARLEWGAARASAAVLRVLRSTRPGMTELAAIGTMGYEGEPQSCHPIVASADAATPLNGLRSASARTIAHGDAVTCGVGYWGGLCCRAGLLTDAVDDAFVETYVRPYFAALAAWWTTLGIGVTGGEMHAAVLGALGDAPFRPLLNPGHLTSSDEWVHSPIDAGSPTPLVSGMVFQCDIIPTPMPPGRALNCEDTAALGDEALRAELATRHPELWSRIEARRAFMRDELGLPLKPEVLPLSTAPAYLPPFWLAPDLVTVMAS